MTEDQTKYSGLRVIGAGFGRTGTSSFREGMAILKLPCYHMLDNMKHKDSPFWASVGSGEKVDFDTIFARGKPEDWYLASVDNPSSMCWEEQLKQYPDAKVVLTTRDFESWYRSCKDTIFKMFPNSPYCPTGVKGAMALGLPHSGFIDLNKKLLFPSIGSSWKKAEIKKAFDAYHSKVKATVPPGQLLVFEAKDGWEPLCKFLGLPIPDVPYPRVNDTVEFQTHVNGINRAGWVMGTFLLGVPFLLSEPVDPSGLNLTEEEL
jgi:Sulfotransferase domain